VQRLDPLAGEAGIRVSGNINLAALRILEQEAAVQEEVVAAARRIGLRSIIQVEHDMDIVFGYSDRIIALHQGRVLADATPDAIRADARVVDTVIGRGAR
jgi:ABC-type branched-subunit amino acid transport system ATPase component